MNTMTFKNDKILVKYDVFSSEDIAHFAEVTNDMYTAILDSIPDAAREAWITTGKCEFMAQGLTNRTNGRFEFNETMYTDWAGSIRERIEQNSKLRDLLSGIFHGRKMWYSKVGVVVAKTGCGKQEWHYDGEVTETTETVSVFIPLRDYIRPSTEFFVNGKVFCRNIRKEVQ